MLNVTKHYKSWFVFSAILLVAAIVFLFVFGLNAGIDFRGGTLSEIIFSADRPEIAAIRSALIGAGFADSVVQPTGEQSIIVRTGPQEKAQHDQLLSTIREAFGEITEQQFTSIGPVIGKELRQKAFWQLFLVVFGIVLYITYVFRKVSRPVSSFKFGLTAIIALIHDLLIVVGVFALLGKFFGVEIDSLFVTALLTVLGFSVHDTIVVFDRIRENLRLRPGQDLGEIIDDSVNQTLVRSINTSMTVVFVLTALLLFGGETIFYFVLALLIGILAGTYSSVFIAAPMLLVWHKWSLRRKT
ncbi:MAG: protein translocase subunit SecF [Candidatus Doudnabacteria bacterium]|nr:protein translocase subunit SecF [Candidatus Doudnabacteria bacterium]